MSQTTMTAPLPKKPPTRPNRPQRPHGKRRPVHSKPKTTPKRDDSSQRASRELQRVALIDEAINLIAEAGKLRLSTRRLMAEMLTVFATPNKFGAKNKQYNCNEQHCYRHAAQLVAGAYLATPWEDSPTTADELNFAEEMFIKFMSTAYKRVKERSQQAKQNAAA